MQRATPGFPPCLCPPNASSVPPPPPQTTQARPPQALAQGLSARTPRVWTPLTPNGNGRSWAVARSSARAPAHAGHLRLARVRLDDGRIELGLEMMGWDGKYATWTGRRFLAIDLESQLISPHRFFRLAKGSSYIAVGGGRLAVFNPASGRTWVAKSAGFDVPMLKGFPFGARIVDVDRGRSWRLPAGYGRWLPNWSFPPYLTSSGCILTPARPPSPLTSPGRWGRGPWQVSCPSGRVPELAATPTDSSARR